jgi:omega-hydroxy-beta-dihydromenaquinone-9 sulfotransferase
MDPSPAERDGWDPWREWFSLHFFTTLQGIAADTWWQHLRQNSFRVGFGHLARVALISVSSPVNSSFAKKDQRVFGDAIAKTEIQPPIFLLGHWRSGTTLLQRYFAMDERFSYPNFYQCVFPRGFLHSQEKNMKRWAGMLPKTRIFDQMDNDFASAAEDEFALCSLTGYSPYMGWSFPQNWDHYYRYLTFRNVPASELKEWKEAFLYFVRKVQFHTGKRVVLKSPPHTCRIKLLLDLFPGAKFVHIRRHPLAVFPSTKKMLTTFLKSTQLQSFDPSTLDQRIIDVYRELYDAFFDELSLIPKSDFCDIAYETLEQNPVETLRGLYEQLSLPDFSVIEPTIDRYVRSLATYQKNQFRPLPTELVDRLAREWDRSFTSWEYSLDPAGSPA